MIYIYRRAVFRIRFGIPFVFFFLEYLNEICLFFDPGDFELWSAGKKGAVIGKYKVSVTTVKESKETKSMAEVRSDDPAYAASLAESSSNAAYKAAANEKEKIPAKYNVDTELSKNVTSGTNKIDLDLK